MIVLWLLVDSLIVFLAFDFLVSQIGATVDGASTLVKAAGAFFQTEIVLKGCWSCFYCVVAFETCAGAFFP